MTGVSHDSVLNGLDPEQREVAEFLDAPLVVLAGAGTGKTRAITHRIAHAVQIGRYAARATLAVTFTTRAAGEMKARLAKLEAHGVQARTIHSAALRQARYFWPKAYGVELPPVSTRTLQIVARVAAGVVGRPETALLRDLAAEISWAKSTNVTPTDYVELAERFGRRINGATPAQVAAIMTGYERAKANEGVIDFDDILLCTAALLADHAEIRDEVRQVYQHFIVDEYQDISAIQHTLLKLWVGDRPDLCVVGDPNQSIHSFAGARSEYLLRFPKDWPGARQLELFRNYRSTPQILSMANRVIVSGRGVELHPTMPPGPIPELVRFQSDADEAAGVATWLRQKHQAGVPWAELAVLYRINAQSPALESALAEQNIPYLVRGSERYYERAEIRQVLALIKAQAAKAPESEAIEAVSEILASAGWQESAPTSQGAQRERWESLNSLFDLVKDLVDAEQLNLGEVAEEISQRAVWEQPPTGQAVTLSTMHAAKGLEWQCVALVGIREGLVPFVLAESPPAVAEERRLLYVGLTRARNDLRISWATQGGRGRSRFLKPFAERVSEQHREHRRVTSLQSRKCRVCSAPLSSAAERKLGRCEECPSSYDEEVLEKLKEWRRRQAQAQSAPAFVIFTDATLVALAEAVPRDRAALLKVPGIGTVKADRYGDAVLDILSTS